MASEATLRKSTHHPECADEEYVAESESGLQAENPFLCDEYKTTKVGDLFRLAPDNKAWHNPRLIIDNQKDTALSFHLAKLWIQYNKIIYVVHIGSISPSLEVIK